MTTQQQPTILVVEDDEHIAEPLVYGLQAEGFRVVRARDGVEGVELARHEAPDLMLLDVMLPRLDGFGVARQLRGEGAALEPTLNASVESLAQSLADRVLGTGAAGSPAQGRGQ